MSSPPLEQSRSPHETSASFALLIVSGRLLLHIFVSPHDTRPQGPTKYSGKDKGRVVCGLCDHTGFWSYSLTRRHRSSLTLELSRWLFPPTYPLSLFPTLRQGSVTCLWRWCTVSAGGEDSHLWCEDTQNTVSTWLYTASLSILPTQQQMICTNNAAESVIKFHSIQAYSGVFPNSRWMHLKRDVPCTLHHWNNGREAHTCKVVSHWDDGKFA